MTEVPEPWVAAGELARQVLRLQPADRSELVAALGSEGLADAAVTELRATGLLEEDAAGYVYLRPDGAVGRQVIGALQREREKLSTVIDLMEQLPELARSWELGAAPQGQALQGETIHGSDAAVQRWLELFTSHPPKAPCAAFPDLEWVHEHVAPLQVPLEAAYRQGGYPIRYLFPIGALESARDQALIDLLVGIGISVRVTARLPSWFYVDREVMVGLPTTWGSHAPTGMVFVRATPVAAAVQALFDDLWAAATPVQSQGQPWQPVLQLLALGRTDGQIAAALGLGIRTVRRRIAEAMDDLGVTTRFELGVQWARRR